VGIPIVNKRISLTQMALIADASDTEITCPLRGDDRAAETCVVNFNGG
jgi:uncharacterized protein (UPF0210 family)